MPLDARGVGACEADAVVLGEVRLLEVPVLKVEVIPTLGAHDGGIYPAVHIARPDDARVHIFLVVEVNVEGGEPDGSI